MSIYVGTVALGRRSELPGLRSGSLRPAQRRFKRAVVSQASPKGAVDVAGSPKLFKIFL